MRATLGRVVVVALLSCAVCGCRSGSNMLAWGRKKPDSSALADAPTYQPSLPSAGQSPGETPTNVPGSSFAAGGSTGAKGTSLAAAAGSSAPQGSYQQAVYPATPYPQVQIGKTAGTSTQASWNNSTGNPGPAVGYAAGSQPVGGYGYGPGSASPPSYSAGSPVAASAGSPSANITQPQAGFYNPAYDGAPGSNSYAAADPNARYATGAVSTSNVQAPPAAAPPSYRTADARSGMTVQPATAAVSAPPAAAQPAPVTLVGDRYANISAGNGMSSGAAAPTSASVTNPYLNSPPGVAASGTSAEVEVAAASPVGDRYSRPASDYRPGTTDYQPGNTGYNPPNAYSAPATTPPPASSLPARNEPGYRPGGTGDYAPPGVNMLRPNANTNSQSENRPQPGIVTPASYTAPIPAGQSQTSSSALAPPPRASSGSAVMETNGSLDETSASEQAYGASAPPPAEPELFPGHAW